MAQDGLSIKLIGAAKLDRALSKMAITHQSKTTSLVFQSINSGAAEVRKEAVKEAPQDMGTLRDSIKNKASRKNKRRNIFMALVFYKFDRGSRNIGSGGWYSLFVERGTDRGIRPMNILAKAAKRAKPKARKKIGDTLVKKIAKMQQKIINGEL